MCEFSYVHLVKVDSQICTWIQNPDLHLVLPNYVFEFTNRNLKQIDVFFAKLCSAHHKRTFSV